MKKTLLFLFLAAIFSLQYTNAYAQPANDDCYSAETLTSDVNCNPTTGSSLNATQSISGSCSGTDDDDVWYQFTAAQSTETITVQGYNGFDAVVEVLTNDCNTENSLSCTDNSGADGVETAVVSGLTVGTTYLIRVYHYDVGDGGGDFDICVTHVVPPAPSNDDCSGAISLTSDVACNYTTGSSLGATQSISGSCGGTDDDDVWYSFTALAATHTVTVVGSNGYDAVVDVLSGACDGTSISCTDVNPANGTETAVVSGLTIGDNYYIRVYHYDVGDGGGDFQICVTHTVAAPPANDDCSGAISLTSDTTCNYTAGSSLGATQSITTGTCGGNDDDDVWYSFTAVDTAHTVTVQGNNGYDPVVDVLSGACNGTSISCTDVTTANGIETAAVSGLTIGNVYYVRVYHYGVADGGGDFSICVTHAAPVVIPPPANDDCANAITLTSDTTCNYTTGSSLGATSSITGTCPGTDDDDVWYQFTAMATTHNITVQGSGGFDPVIDVRSGACTGTNIACMDASGANGLETAIASGLTVGSVYYIRVYHWGVGDGGGAFQICVTHAAPVPPANDNCSAAINITSDTTCNYTSGSSLGATQSITTGTCGGTDDDDVWYKFTAVDTTHTINVQGYNGYDAVVDVRSGSCPGSSISCTDATLADGLETAVVGGLTIGSVYYIRVYHYGVGDGGGSFDICVTNSTPSSASCTYAISPNNHSFTPAAGTGTIAVTSGSGCNWTAVSNNSWITITSGSTGTGNGTVNYSVTANTGNSQRTGTITVGGQTFTVAQSGNTTCTYTISPTSHSFTSAAGTAAITVTSASTCHWTAATNSTWITITSGSTGTGNGTVNYSVTANSGTSQRTGTITIGGQVYNVTQSGTTACTYTIAPTTQSYPSPVATGTINVTTANGCNWTAATNDSWITITSGSTGSGNGTVNYSITANSGTSSRTGTITVGGHNYTITQSGTSACTYTIAPASQTFPMAAGTGTVNVTAANGCNWTAVTTTSWITITSGATGSGNGTVGYSITANSGTSQRTGTITIGGQTYTVIQNGSVACTYTIAPASQTFTSAAATGTVNVTTANTCTWTASTTDSWITITSGSTGTGNGTVSYSITANSGASQRTGTITIGGQTYTVIQNGSVPCTYTISPAALSFTSLAGTGVITVTAASGCSWTAATTDAWITITSGSTGTGNGTVNYSVSANPNSTQRLGTITVGGQTHNVVQNGTASCTYTISPATQTFTSPADSGTVNVTAINGCAWTSSSNNSWITITLGASGSGNGLVKFTITTNTNTASRTGTLTIGGQTFTVTQNGITCPVTPVIQNVGCALASNPIPNVTYQWYIAGSPISGATTQFYTATQDGFYSVYVTDITNNCVTISSPTYVSCSFAGISELDLSNAVSIFPNPSSGNFNITSGKIFTEEKVIISIYNIYGQEIYSSSAVPVNGAMVLTIENIRPARGIYSILLKSGKTKIQKRIVFE